MRKSAHGVTTVQNHIHFGLDGLSGSREILCIPE